MSANIVLFDSKAPKLPAHIKARMGQSVDNAALGQVRSGFPVLSLKGKRFNLVEGGERTVILDPRTDEPANSITVAMIRVNPGISKAWYPNGYVEGSTEKPECFSNDGIKPDASATSPQAKTCAACPHNQFNTARDEKGGTRGGKACPDTKRVAVAQIDELDKPILLRVPPTSLKNLASHGKFLAEKGVDARWAATKIGFDPETTHQVLTFRAVGFLTDEAIAQVEAMQTDEVVLQITGESAVPAPVEESPAPAPVAKPKAKPAPAPVVEEEEDEDDFEEEEDAPAPPPKAAKAKPATRTTVKRDKPTPAADLEEDIGDFLAGGFDD